MTTQKLQMYLPTILEIEEALVGDCWLAGMAVCDAIADWHRKGWLEK
jgi:hypothetical protein